MINIVPDWRLHASQETFTQYLLCTLALNAFQLYKLFLENDESFAYLYQVLLWLLDYQSECQQILLWRSKNIIKFKIFWNSDQVNFEQETDQSFPIVKKFYEAISINIGLLYCCVEMENFIKNINIVAENINIKLLPQ